MVKSAFELAWDARLPAGRCRGDRRRPAGYELRARATDVTGAGQPDTVPHNTLGYLFDGVVRHPVTVA